MSFSKSPVSQAAADFTAQQQAQLCALDAASPYDPESGPGGGGSGGGGGGGGGGPQPLIFFNSPQECTVNCPDGLPFTYQVPAGAFSGTTQAAADTAAQTYACAQANQRVICLSALTPGSYIVNSPYTGTITATGGSIGSNPTWQLTGGSLPTGLTISFSGVTATISGTPTVGGTFTFTLSCTDAQGDTMNKTFTLACGTSYTVDINRYFDGANFHSPGWQITAPDSSYDTAWKTTQNLCAGGQASQFEAQFTSATLKTWNLKAIVPNTASPGLFINGVAQAGWVAVGLNLEWTGTFSTNNCANTTVGFTSSPSTGCATGTIEWLTPP